MMIHDFMKKCPIVINTLIAIILLSVSVGQPEGKTVQANTVASMNRSDLPTVDDNVDLVTDSKWNYFGDAAYNSTHDEFLFVWVTEQDSASRDIWARRVGRDGRVLSIFNVANSEGDVLERPYVAYNPVLDEYFIVYTNWYDSSGDSDIFAKRMSWNGEWISGVIEIIDTVDEQFTFSLAYNSRDNEYLVAYVNQWAGDVTDVYAQRRSADGSLLSWNAVASSSEAARTFPSVAYNPSANGGAGGYLFVYYYYHNTNYTSKLLMKTSRADLSDVWTNPEVQVCAACLPSFESKTASDGENYLIVWWDSEAADYQVKGRRVSGDGILQGDSDGFGISNVNLSPPIYTDLDLNYSAVYGFLTLWQHETLTTEEVYGNFIPAGADNTPHTPFGITDPDLFIGRWTGACAPLDCLVGYEWWNVDNYDLAARFLRPNRIYNPVIFY